MTQAANWEPPADLDPAVLKLCQVLNAMPGLHTRGSCGGHDGGDRPADRWYVTVAPDLDEDHRPTVEGWLSLEFLTWMLSDMRRAVEWLVLDPWALPPFLNFPGRMLYFAIEGERGEGGEEPDDVADRLEKLHDELRPHET